MRQRLGEDWGPLLLGVARSTANPTHYRTRALDLMQLYGPSPCRALAVGAVQRQERDHPRQVGRVDGHLRR